MGRFLMLLAAVLVGGCAPGGGGGGGGGWSGEELTPAARCDDVEAELGQPCAASWGGFLVGDTTPDGAVPCNLAITQVYVRCDRGARRLFLVSDGDLTAESAVRAMELEEHDEWIGSAPTIVGEICSAVEDADEIRWPLDPNQVNGEAWFVGKCDGWPSVCADTQGPQGTKFSKVLRVDRDAGRFTASHCVGRTRYTTFGESRPLSGMSDVDRVCWDGATGDLAECDPATCEKVVGQERVPCR